MSKVFLTADLHIGHMAICKYRTQFATPAEHDEYIIDNWNSVVTKAKYQVWVLGDMLMKNKYYDMDKIIGRLNGTIQLITGNHDHLPYYDNSRINIRNGIFKKYGFWLSHCPIHPQELRGNQNIHGHIHGVENQLHDDRYINVNCEFHAYTPVDLDRIR